MFVLSDFLFQKWLCHGFRYCLIWMKETNLISGADQRLIDLVRSSQQILYCIFHFLEIDEVEGAVVPFDIDKINDFVEEMAAIVPIIHSEVFQSGVDSLRSDSTEKKKPK